tara:strand:+ start:158 stop:418 length:261 start_codon:yes stop_codon:yes gene_type:complete
MIENEVQSEVVFRGVSAPDEHPRTSVNRMTINHVDYTFTDIGNGEIEILIKSKFSPANSAPEWLLETWFPDGPTDMLKRIVDLAKQ